MSPDDQSSGEKSAPSGDSNHALTLKLALIEHGSRPAAYLLIAVIVLIGVLQFRDPLFDLLDRSQHLRVGSFEVRLQERVRAFEGDEDLKQAFSRLKNLNEDQIALFLVVGAPGRDNYQFSSHEVTPENLQALQSAGLISGYTKNADGSYTWTSTPEAARLYQFVVDELTRSFERTR